MHRKYENILEIEKYYFNKRIILTKDSKQAHDTRTNSNNIKKPY